MPVVRRAGSRWDGTACNWCGDEDNIVSVEAAPDSGCRLTLVLCGRCISNIAFMASELGALTVNVDHPGSRQPIPGYNKADIIRDKPPRSNKKGKV